MKNDRGMTKKKKARRIVNTVCLTFFVLYALGAAAGVANIVAAKSEYQVEDAKTQLLYAAGGLLFFGALRWVVIPLLPWLKDAPGTDVLCPQCSYNMRGLSQAKCPECGAEFTIDQLKLK